MEDFKSPALKGTTNVKKVDPVPFRPSGILHFTISVPDLDDAIEFYTTIVGATLWRRISYSAFRAVGDNFFVLSNIGYHRRPNDSGHCRTFQMARCRDCRQRSPFFVPTNQYRPPVCLSHLLGASNRLH